MSGADAAAVKEVLQQHGRRARVAFARPGLLLAFVGRACLASAHLVGRLARESLVDLLDRQGEASGELGREDVDLIAALRAFAFDGKRVAEDEQGDLEPGDLLADLGEAFFGGFGDRGGQGEGEAEFVGMAQPDPSGP